uniref:Uncharacterized protein n=1 Tax=Rhabditophanes sp. KR3021 TaxID=114890 RepID=A0AC35U6W0_9BILA
MSSTTTSSTSTSTVFDFESSSSEDGTLTSLKVNLSRDHSLNGIANETSIYNDLISAHSKDKHLTANSDFSNSSKNIYLNKKRISTLQNAKDLDTSSSPHIQNIAESINQMYTSTPSFKNTLNSLPPYYSKKSKSSNILSILTFPDTYDEGSPQKEAKYQCNSQIPTNNPKQPTSVSHHNLYAPPNTYNKYPIGNGSYQDVGNISHIQKRLCIYNCYKIASAENLTNSIYQDQSKNNVIKVDGIGLLESPLSKNKNKLLTQSLFLSHHLLEEDILRNLGNGM